MSAQPSSYHEFDSMTADRWQLEPSSNGSKQLLFALAGCGFTVKEPWPYPPHPEPFTTPFTDGTVDVVVEFENPNGVVVLGPPEAIRKIQAEYARLTASGS